MPSRRGPSRTRTASSCSTATATAWRSSCEPYPGSADTLRYLLVPKGAPVPDYPADAVVRTPVERVAALSTTHLAMLNALGVADRIVAVADAKFVNTPAVQARLATGAAVAVGEGETLDVETLAALKPDVVLMSSLGGGGAARRSLDAAGIPVVLDGDWVEASPLGRAEWLRFAAAFFDRDARADSLMDTIASRYATLAREARQAATRPTVFVGSSFQGTWYAPGGGSYMATLIADAGGKYLWRDTPETGSLALDVESVLARARDADVWLNPGTWRSLADGRAQDATYALFGAFQQGRVYNYTARQSAGGGYDFFETGVVQPDVLLADLIRILHPGVLADTALVYYERLR